MEIMRKVVIGDGGRGLLHRNRRFERVFQPGATRVLRPFETLAKVTEKIGKRTVFGGHDGVLRRLVSLKSA